MARPATNVHEHWLLRVPAFSFLLNWVRYQPSRHFSALSYHEGVEITGQLWMIPVPQEDRELCIPSFLKGRVGGIVRVLVFGLSKE